MAELAVSKFKPGEIKHHNICATSGRLNNIV